MLGYRTGLLVGLAMAAAMAVSTPLLADEIMKAEDIAAALAGGESAVSGEATRGISGIKNTPVRGAVSLSTITFATNSADPTAEAKQQVAELAGAINSVRPKSLKPNTLYLIVGHTDTQGDRTYNLELSKLRAKNVALMLTHDFNIPENEIMNVGVGQDYPAFDKDPPDSRRNRRVEIINCKQQKSECDDRVSKYGL